MEKMKTLTVSGQTYTVSDPEAVHSIDGRLPEENGDIRVVDDHQAGAHCWSGKHIIECMCPSFTQSAALVECTPVAGYPLEVVSNIVSIQTGEGDPSPENIRPITGHTAVQLTLSNGEKAETVTQELGRVVYGGTLDWTTGVLTINTKKITLTGKESWGKLTTNPNTTVFTSTTIGGMARAKDTYIGHLFGVSSHFVKNRYATSGGAQKNSFYWTHDGGLLRVCYGLPNGTTTQAELNQFLAEQYANGTPVEFVCQIETPVTVSLTPQTLLALSGGNTVSSNTGDTQVTGRSDLPGVLEKLTNALLALGGNL